MADISIKVTDPKAGMEAGSASQDSNIKAPPSMDNFRDQLSQIPDDMLKSIFAVGAKTIQESQRTQVAELTPIDTIPRNAGSEPTRRAVDDWMNRNAEELDKFPQELWDIIDRAGLRGRYKSYEPAPTNSTVG